MQRNEQQESCSKKRWDGADQEGVGMFVMLGHVTQLDMAWSGDG